MRWYLLGQHADGGVTMKQVRTSPFGLRSVMSPCFIWRETIQTFNGYATAKPAITPRNITPQNSSSVGSMARMSRPIIRSAMTGASSRWRVSSARVECSG